MYDVDPKWAEIIKDRGNISNELQKRLSTSDRKSKSSGRSQVLTTPPDSTSSSTSTVVTQTNLATSMASTLSFSSLASAGLGSLPTTGLAPGILSGLSLSSFDPKNSLFEVKNNPLLDPKNNPFLDPKNHPLFDPKNLALFDPKNSALFDPKGNPFFDPKSNPLLDAKNNPLFDAKSNSLFDPKNPLLLPFGGLPNMGALSGMGHLSNSMNFFANLANMGLPSLAGLDPNASGVASTLPPDQGSPGSTSGKGKSRKSTNESDRHPSKTSTVSSSTPVSTPSISNAVSAGLPFYFPNPSLLYSPLGLGGLNPFSLPPAALSSTYDNLAQQCGLLNGGLGASTSGSQSTRGNGSHRSQNSSGSSKSNASAASNSNTSHRHHRSGRDSMDRHNFQHLLLPHDAHLLESLGRASSIEVALRNSEKKNKEGLDRKEFSERSEKRSKDSDCLVKSADSGVLSSSKSEDKHSRKTSKVDYDKKDTISAQTLLMSSLSEMDERMMKRLREPDMKEALEVLSRSHAELLSKSGPENSLKISETRDFPSVNMSDLIARTIEEHSTKRSKENLMKETLALSGTSLTEVKKFVDPTGNKLSSSLFSDVPESGGKIEEIKEMTVKKMKDKASALTSVKPEDSEVVKEEETVNRKSKPDGEGEYCPLTSKSPQSENRLSLDSSEKSDEAGESESGRRSDVPDSNKSARSRRSRNSKKAKGKSEADDQPLPERKNLRSSAGRAARAAAERAALKESTNKENGNNDKSDDDEQKQAENGDDV